MEQRRKDARHEPVITDLEALVPKDHLLRKIEKVMDYEWLYTRLDPYYCHDSECGAGEIGKEANRGGRKRG